MDISAIIVSYNEVDYLSKCIESCLMQKFKGSFEIIICDDGSNDGSIDLIKKYQKQYPDIIKYKIIDREPNITKENVIASLRASNLVKEGLNLSTGDYIVAISGDDYFIDEYKFQKQYNFLTKHNNLESCYTDFYWVMPNGKQLKSNNKINSRFIFWGLHYSHLSSFMFSKKVKEYVLPRICDDVGLIYSIFLTGKTRVLKDTFFVYNCRSDSITQSYKNIEGSVGELLLFQEIKNYQVKLGTYSRFFNSINTVYKHKNLLNNNYYKKYLRASSNHKNDLLNRIAKYNNCNCLAKAKIQCLIFHCRISYYFHKTITWIYYAWKRQ